MLIGRNAIEYAEVMGSHLHKFKDPTEGSREITLDEAREIASVDPGLVYVNIDPDVSRFLIDLCYESGSMAPNQPIPDQLWHQAELWTDVRHEGGIPGDLYWAVSVTKALAGDVQHLVFWRTNFGLVP